MLRLEYADFSRSIVLEAGGDGQLTVLESAPGPGRVVVVNPATCQVIGSVDLLSTSSWINIADDGPGGSKTIWIGPKGIEPGEFEQLPATGICPVDASPSEAP
jgi:hypothetical protein